jgi:hypothetical protein
MGSRCSIRPPSSDCKTQAVVIEKYSVNLRKEQTTRTAFTISLKNRFQVLQELITGEIYAHELWKRTKDTFTETCQEVFRQKKKQHKDCISVDTILKIQTRRLKKDAVNLKCTSVSKVATQAEYIQSDMEVKRNLKRDKNYI